MSQYRLGKTETYARGVGVKMRNNAKFVRLSKNFLLETRDQSKEDEVHLSQKEWLIQLIWKGANICSDSLLSLRHIK